MRTRARTRSIEMSRRLLHSSRTRVSFDGLIANFLMTPVIISNKPMFLKFSVGRFSSENVGSSRLGGVATRGFGMRLQRLLAVPLLITASLCAIHVQQISQSGRRTDAKRMSHSPLLSLGRLFVSPKVIPRFNIRLIVARPNTKLISGEDLSCDVQASRRFCQVGLIF